MSNDSISSSQATDTPSSPSRSVEQVLNAIDFEINRIESEQKRPGWTLWAVSGSIASALWLLSDQWEKGNVDVINVIQLFLVFSILRDIVHYASRQLLPPRKRHYKLSPRFRFPTEDESPIGMFFYWIRFVLLFLLSLFLASKVFWLQSAILFFFYGAFTLIGAFGFGSTYFDFLVLTRHVPKTRIEHNKRITVFWISILIALTWAMVGHLAYVVRYSDLVSMSDFRVAGMLLIISFLVPMLFDNSKGVPILVSLTEIRRDLAFGRIDVNSAIRHADIAIAGIPVEDRLQEEIRNVLNLFEQVEKEYQRFFYVFEQLLAELPKNDSEITREQERRAGSILIGSAQEIPSLLNKHDELRRLTRGLRIRASIAEEVAPESVKAAKDVLEKIDLLHGDIEAKAINLQNNVLPMVERLKRVRERLAQEKAK